MTENNRPLYSSTVRTQHELTSAYMQNQVHSEWYTLLYGAIRDEVDHEGHEYTHEELEVLESAAQILQAKQ